MSKKVKRLERELTELEAARSVKRAELDAALSDLTVKCHAEHCGKRFQVKNLVYNQQHHYISPHGCTGGDYWMESEGDFICPACGTRNRLFQRPRVEALKKYFKKVNKVYLSDTEKHAEDRKAGRTFVN